MYIVTKSLSGDFSGSLNTDQLHQEILDSAITNVTTNFDGINVDGDVVQIMFISALSGGDLAILNALIAAYVAVFRGSNIATAYSRVYQFAQPYYQIIGKLSFKGTDVWDLTNIEVSTWMDTGVTSYSIKIYDPTNVQIISENTFTNTDPSAIQQITPINNLPTSPTLFEIWGRLNGTIPVGGLAYCDYIRLYFN